MSLAWEGPVIGMGLVQKKIQCSSFTVAKTTFENFYLNDKERYPSNISPKQWKIQVKIMKKPLNEKPTIDSHDLLTSTFSSIVGN